METFKISFDVYAPNWLFLYPELILLAAGIMLFGILLLGQLSILDMIFSIHTLLYSSAFIVMGFTASAMFVLIKTYAYNYHYLPGGEGLEQAG